jgi:hypothetical protein
MSNPVGQNLLLALGTMAATMAGVWAFAFMKFPANAVIIALSVLAVSGLAYFSIQSGKKARFKIYYSTVQEYGMPISFNNTNAAFERNGTRFDIDFPQGKYENFFKVKFYLPNVSQKFSIQNKTLQTEFYDDCQVIENSPLPQEYRVQSRDPAFLLNLLNQKHIFNEIQNYPAGFFGRILISFADGDFEMIWTPPISEQIEGFYQVCHSSVVFYDELKKFQKR